VFTGATAPLPMPEGGLKDGTGTTTPFVYSDRTFWWANVPAELIGVEHIRTFNDDKEPAAENVTYTVTISRTSTLWIGIESRLFTQTTTWIAPLPSWGNSLPPSRQAVADWLTRDVAAPGTFTDTGLTLGLRESASTLRTVAVFSASLPAGSYVFRHQSNRSVSNYVIGAVPPPSTAFNPNPIDGETLVPVSKVLSWTAPEDPNYLAVLGYNVYLDPNAAKVANADPSVRVSSLQAGTSFDPTPDLLYSTKYFWRADISVIYDNDPNRKAVIKAGPVWSFTTVPANPMIVLDPVGLSRGPACGRLNAVFTVQAANATDYQWYKNGAKLTGATGATLNITGVTPADEATYFCRASNAAGSVDSATVWLDYARQTSQWDFEDSFADVLGGHTMIPAGAPEAVPTFGAGKLGSAVVLDGVDDYALIPPDALPKNRSSLTLAFWARNDAGPSARTAFYANTAAEPTNRILSVQIPFTNSSAQFDLANANSGGSYDRVATAMRAATDPWVYWVVTKDVETGTMSTYQNGVLLGRNTAAQRLVYGAEEFYLGARNLGGELGLGQFFHGAIDDLRIYNYALNPVEIAYLYTDVTGETVCVNANDPVLVQFDYDGNCIVDLGDLAVFASHWLSCQRVPGCLDRP
jgi:hypothetical protein